MSGDRSEFLAYLEGQVTRYRGIIERMFGPFDRRFAFGSVGRVPPGEQKPQPRVHFPSRYSGGVVDIWITPKPYDRCWRDQATWQIAHECIHLLDPCEEGEANYLEEGMATWFQMEPRFHNKVVKGYLKKNRGRLIRDPRYVTALGLVRRNMPGLKTLVREIRGSGTRLCEITPSDLHPHLTRVGEKVLRELCEPFPVSKAMDNRRAE